MFTKLLALSMILTVNCKFIRYVKRCPTREERHMLDKHPLCNSTHVYHCVEDLDFKLVETCSKSIQIPPGNYPRYSLGDRIMYDPCTDGRYQPWPVKSYEISTCELVKSSCNGIGQVDCGNGTTTKDVTCGCDYRNQYVLSGSDRCCSPSGIEKCFCLYRPCPNPAQELNSDYICVDKCMPGYERPVGQSVCELIPNTTSSTNMSSSTKPTISTEIIATTIPIDRKRTTVVFIIIGIGFILCFIFMLAIGVLGPVWRPFRKRFIPYSVYVGILIICSAIVIFDAALGIYGSRLAMQCAVSILIVAIVIYAGYAVYLLTYTINKERITYNEDYDVEVFKLLTAAADGDINTLKSLREQRYVDMYDTDYDKRSALHLAACEGKDHAVKYLLDNHIGYPQAKDRCMGHTAADDAEWHKKNRRNQTTFNRIIQLLKTYKGAPKEKNHFRDMIAGRLVKGAETGDIAELQRLYGLGTDMNLSDSDGRTALHIAADKGQKEVVEFLIDKCRVSPFVRWRGNRPTDLIKDDNQNIQMKQKLESYMNDELNSSEDFSKEVLPKDQTVVIVRLLNSASQGDIRQMRRLKEAGCKMTMADYDSRTALHIAVSDNQEHIVEYLLDKCNMASQVEKIEDRWKKTPFSIAKQRGKENIFRKILEYCPNAVNTESDEYKTFSLLMAGNKGTKEDIQTLMRLFEKGVDMNMQDYDGRTALHVAAAEWNVEAVKYLIETCNCNTTITDRYGRKPADDIDEASNKDHFKTFVFSPSTSTTDSDVTMIDEEISSKIETKTRLFSRAKTRSKANVLRDLSKKSIKQKKKPASQITDQSKRSLLFETAAKGDTDTLKTCNYPYYDISDYITNTPLHLAAANGHTEMVKYLIEECHASPFVRDNAMKRAIDVTNDQVALWVNRAGTVTNLRQRKTFSDIRNYLDKKMNDLIQEKPTDADPSFTKYDPDVQIFMLLNKAYKGDIVSIRRYILSDKSIINKTDYDQRSALHIAVAEKHEHLVKYFLEELRNDIDINLKDRWGKTPLDDAEENQYKEIVKIFEDAQTDNS